MSYLLNIINTLCYEQLLHPRLKPFPKPIKFSILSIHNFIEINFRTTYLVYINQPINLEFSLKIQLFISTTIRTPHL